MKCSHYLFGNILLIYVPIRCIFHAVKTWRNFMLQLLGRRDFRASGTHYDNSMKVSCMRVMILPLCCIMLVIQFMQ